MQCTILQPKGTLRTSTLPTGVDGIPTSKDIAAVLRRATEPEHAGTLPLPLPATKDEQLLIFGYKTGKTGTENQHTLSPAAASFGTLYGEAVVVAMKAGKPTPFPSAQWTAYLKKLEDEEEDEDEFGEGDDFDEDEEKDAEEAEAEVDAEDTGSVSSDESDEDELVEEEEEEAPPPVFKAPRAKRSNKKTPQWLAIPVVTIAQDSPHRLQARQQIHHFLHNQMTADEEAELERGILQHAIAEAQRTHVHPVWENREFAVLYDIQVRRVISNMHKRSYVDNARLDVRFHEGEFTAAELATMPFSSLCPEKWKDLFEKEMKREAKMLEVDKSMATDMFRCTKCGKRQCTYYEMQTRSADEPMTIFVRCLNCGKRWRQ